VTPVWNTLEVAKLGVAAATPIAVAVIGFSLARIMKRIELAQWHNQKVIEKRMSVYDYAATRLNQVYCYFRYVGTWKEIAPADVIRLKRELDTCVYVNEWLFSQPFIDSYKFFINCCFVTHTGVGLDARLRTKFNKREGLPNWRANWADHFVTESTVGSELFKQAYNALMSHFAAELGSPRAEPIPQLPALPAAPASGVPTLDGQPPAGGNRTSSTLPEVPDIKPPPPPRT
jgi:hypothetical protein